MGEIIDLACFRQADKAQITKAAAQAAIEVVVLADICDPTVEVSSTKADISTAKWLARIAAQLQ